MNDEYIKILEELKASLSKNIERLYDNDISTTMYNIFSLRKRQGQAIENLLNRNKELEEIEQEHKKENGELREKVAALEEENTVLKKVNNISENIKIEDITKFINKSIEDFNKEYVPVEKVKEKIEKLNKNIDLSIDNSKGGLDEEFIDKASELLAQKRILQELLEGK